MINYNNNAGEQRQIKTQQVYPGTLVEVDGKANLL